MVLLTRLMKKLALLLTLSISTLSHAWTIEGYGDYKFEAITDNVYVIHGPLDEPNAKNKGFMNNPGMIIGADGVIVIDPGGSYQTGQKVINEVSYLHSLDNLLLLIHFFPSFISP